MFLFGTLIFSRSSVKLSAFLIPKFNFGVVANLGVPGVFLEGLGEGEKDVLVPDGLASFSFAVANRLAAGDMVANRSKVEVFGRGEGLKSKGGPVKLLKNVRLGVIGFSEVRSKLDS